MPHSLKDIGPLPWELCKKSIAPRYTDLTSRANDRARRRQTHDLREVRRGYIDRWMDNAHEEYAPGYRFREGHSAYPRW
jgi:hypothetical protein